MNFITPPTDNLYKFIAICGLALIGFSFYPASKIAEAEKNTINIKAEIAKYEVSAESLQKIIDEQSNTSASKIVLDNMNEKHKQNKERLIEINKMAALLANDIEWIGIYQKTSVISAVFGLLLSVLGFWFWYFKVQQPLDQTAIKHIS